MEFDDDEAAEIARWLNEQDAQDAERADAYDEDDEPETGHPGLSNLPQSHPLK